MKIRGLIVAIVLLAALTGALYWSNRHPASEAAKSSTAAEVAPKILNLKDADILGLVIKKKDGGEIELDKVGTDWRITKPQAFPADQSGAVAMATELANLETERLVDDHAADLAQFGLGDPAITVAIRENGNKTQSLLIGDATPTGNFVYAKSGNDSRVFTVASFHKTTFDKGLNDLRDKRLITIASDKVTQLEIVEKQKDVAFVREAGHWEIVKPKSMRADDGVIDSLVHSVTETRMDLTADDAKKDVASFAAAAPMATVKVTGEGGTQELQIRKSKDQYYVRASVADGAFRVAGDLSQQINKNLDDFRNKKIFDQASLDPDKIEIHDGAKAYIFARSGDDWWSAEGKKLDAETIEQLVSRLRDLQAASFADSGLGPSAMEIAITSNNGKQLEKVRIAKANTGDNYIALRDNDGTFYVLNGSAITDLQKSLEDVKPALPAKK